MQSCHYELTESHDPNTVLLHQGEAFSVNISTGGMLLLMPHAPHFEQVFEVHAPMPEGKPKKKLTLVEVRWTRQIPVEAGESMSLVGVKFLPRLPTLN